MLRFRSATENNEMIAKPASISEAPDGGAVGPRGTHKPHGQAARAADDPHANVRKYMDAVVPGSFLVVSDTTNEVNHPVSPRAPGG